MRKLFMCGVVLYVVAINTHAQQGQLKLNPNGKPLKLEPGVLAPAVANLKMVKVSAPNVYCLFDPKCEFAVKLPDNEVVSDIVIGGAQGKGFLQSRTLQTSPTSPAAGMYVYVYRVDMTGVKIVSGKVPTFTSFRINFGPVVDTLDYDGDGQKGDQVFIITGGALGSVAPSAAVYDGSTITFQFNNPRLAGGSGQQNGASSFYFGLVSKSPPRNVGVRATVNEGTGLNLSARAPKF